MPVRDIEAARLNNSKLPVRPTKNQQVFGHNLCAFPPQAARSGRLASPRVAEKYGCPSLVYNRRCVDQKSSDARKQKAEQQAKSRLRRDLEGLRIKTERDRNTHWAVLSDGELTSAARHKEARRLRTTPLQIRPVADASMQRINSHCAPLEVERGDTCLVIRACSTRVEGGEFAQPRARDVHGKAARKRDNRP